MLVDAYYLVVCARGQILPIAREAHRVYCARVIAHGGQLPGLSIIEICGIIDGVRGPYANETIWENFD